MIHWFCLRLQPCRGVAAVHAVVVAAGPHHDVPAGAAVHHGRAWLLADHLLRARRASRAHAADD